MLPAFTYVTEYSRRIATTTQATDPENLLYASSWSLHPEEVMSLVVPEFAGSDAGGSGWTNGTYWGRNRSRDNSPYAGIVVFLLGIVGLLGPGRKGLKWYFAVLGSGGVLYALGAHTPVWRLFFEIVPGVSLFRAPDMVVFLFGFSIITLMAFGVDRVTAAGKPEDESEDESEGRKLTRTLWVLAGTLGFGLLLASSGALFSFWTSVVYQDIPAANLQTLGLLSPFIIRGFFFATILALILAGTAWAYRKRVIDALGVTVILGLVIGLDGIRISAPFIQTFDFAQWAQADPIIEDLLERQGTESPFRVASLSQGGQSVRPGMFGLELATGHHPNDLQAYRELIGMRGSEMPENLLVPNVMRVLNIRYLIVPGQLDQGPEPLQQTQVGGRIYESLYSTQDLFGMAELPRARLVGAATLVPEAETVAALSSPVFDPASSVLLSEEAPLFMAGGPVSGSVEWVERGINRLELRVESDRNALLVIADNWFPGWRARLDGDDTQVIRAYHTLRAVSVPPGEHVIEMYYSSSVLKIGLAATVLSLVLLLSVGTASLARRRRKLTTLDQG
ncbi:MAG: hypothetical protein ABIF09_12510 [Gemmatimonadota bacterium]